MEGVYAIEFETPSLRRKPLVLIIHFCLCLKGRAKSLAQAVSGEARPFEDLPHFQPEKGSILANATPIGMHPNTDSRIPVAEVCFSHVLKAAFSILVFVINTVFFSLFRKLCGITGLSLMPFIHLEKQSY